MTVIPPGSSTSSPRQRESVTSAAPRCEAVEGQSERPVRGHRGQDVARLVALAKAPRAGAPIARADLEPGLPA